MQRLTEDDSTTPMPTITKETETLSQQLLACLENAAENTPIEVTDTLFTLFKRQYAEAMQNETATSLFTPESFSHAIAKSIAEKLIKKQASKSNGAITSLFVLAVTTCLAALVYTMKRDPSSSSENTY